ncbi:hypothetical protein [Streptomyces sp. NPDC003393]
MTGKHIGDEYGFGLAEALGELDTGPEPPMPDLVPGAITQGTRIRRRRRIGVALSTTAMAAVVAVGGYGVLAPAPQSSRTLPAAKTPVRYPSLTLLRSMLPPGKVGMFSQKRPGPYFRLTDVNGLVTDLYVAITQSPTGSSLLPSGPVACRDGFGRRLATPWGGQLVKCSIIPTGSGDSLLQYYTAKESLPPQMRGNGGSHAWGISYLTSDGWKVQVIASPLDKGRENMDGTVPNRAALINLATDHRLLDAVTETAG